MKILKISIAFLLLTTILLSAIGCAIPPYDQNAVLISSKNGNNDLNIGAATFLVWQNMYQQAYTEYIYMQYGLYEDTFKIVRTYPSACFYGTTVAQYYTNDALRQGIDSMTDYFSELVACADAANDLGLQLNEIDRNTIEETVEWVKNIHKEISPLHSFDNFIRDFIGVGISETHIRDALTLIALYKKYCDYTKLEADTALDATAANGKNILLNYIAENPAGHYQTLYHQYQVDDESIANTLASSKDIDSFTSAVIDHVIESKIGSIAVNKYILPRVNEDKQQLDTLLESNGDFAVISNKAIELGLIETVYTKTNHVVDADQKTTEAVYSHELSEEVAQWLFDRQRYSHDMKVIVDHSSAYLIYIYSPMRRSFDNEEETFSISAGIKKYELYVDEMEIMNTFRNTLQKDLSSGSRMPSIAGSEYEAFFLPLKEHLDNVYPCEPMKLVYPRNSTQDSLKEWLCELDRIDTTDPTIAKRIFARKENDCKIFEVQSQQHRDIEYQVCIVVEPMSLIQDAETTVYGGYLKFATEADANAALAKLRELEGYHLWQAFDALNNQSTVENDKLSIHTETIKTALKKADLPDETLAPWFFDETRKMNDVSVIQSQDKAVFYLTYFISAEESWSRNAKDDWRSVTLQDTIDSLIRAGDYQPNPIVLEKTGKSS